MLKHIFGMLLLAFALSSCSAMTPYDFSFSAEDSDRFWLSRAVFNGYIGAGAGNVGCCLATGGATVSVFPEEYPYKGYFVWHDELTDTHYHAHVQYPGNVEELANSLSDSVVLADGVVIKKDIMIITSITTHNWVVTWVANYLGGPGIAEREIIELGRAKGEVLPPVEEGSE